MESDCPAFGKSFDVGTEECAACLDTYPDEYKECARLCGIDTVLSSNEEDVKEDSEVEEMEVEEEPVEEETAETEDEKPEPDGDGDEEEVEEESDLSSDEEPEPEREEPVDTRQPEPEPEREEPVDTRQPESEDENSLDDPDVLEESTKAVTRKGKRMSRNDAFVRLLQSGESFTLDGFIKGIMELSPTLSVTQHPFTLQRWLKLLVSLNVVDKVGDKYSLADCCRQ